MDTKKRITAGICLMLLLTVLGTGCIDTTNEEIPDDVVTKIFYFNGYSFTVWGYPNHMLDGNTETFAKTSSYGIQINHKNTCDGLDIGKIYKVEIRAMGGYRSTGAGVNRISFLPLFEGTKEGDKYWGQDWTVTTSTAYPLPHGEWTEWFDITFDINAPITWTWDDVENMDMKITAERNDDGNGVSIVQIQVTYTILS